MGHDAYLGAGYAVLGEPEREAIRLVARQEGILLDPVYTGKAWFALTQLIAANDARVGKRVLFWHTGGLMTLL